MWPSDRLFEAQQKLEDVKSDLIEFEKMFDHDHTFQSVLAFGSVALGHVYIAIAELQRGMDHAGPMEDEHRDPWEHEGENE